MPREGSSKNVIYPIAHVPLIVFVCAALESRESQLSTRGWSDEREAAKKMQKEVIHHTLSTKHSPPSLSLCRLNVFEMRASVRYMSRKRY